MVEIPCGTVTFVFTDIEGSTRLWQESPEAMKVALELHDVLLRKTIEQHGGYVFKTVGDAFCAAFQSPTASVAAVLEIQKRLKAADWPPGATIRVRASVHTGEAHQRDGDYFGVTLSVVGRLLSAGHGGQVLVSGAASEAVQNQLPEQAGLRSMGTHRLRDLSHPDEVFQLDHPDLDQEFPALATLDNRPNNLPRPRTSFIGRELERLDLEVLSTKAQLLTLTGMGGTGKTRLAIEFAADQVGRFAHGVWFVDLAPLADPELVPNAVADVFKYRSEEGRTMTQTLVERLKDKAMLIVIDNCEHVLDASAELIDEVLHACPNLRLVATSREALGISGEQVYRVRSLATPKPNVDASVLADCDSVQLFVERARLARHDFRVTDANAPAVASICSRLDGIPLAIELAAARLRSMSAQDISSRLDQKFRLLTGGSKTALKRQQTLEGLIDWSYNLLQEAEQELLLRLSVFRGGWTVRLAERVCSDDIVDEFDVLDLLSNLVEKSLIFLEGDSETSRYRILETVRDYASEKLVGSRADVWRDRHLEAITQLAEEGDRLFHGPDQAKWQEAISAETDNIRAALMWASDDPERAETALRLIGFMRIFWSRGSRFQEGYEWATAFLQTTPGEPRTRAQALMTASAMAGPLGRYSESIDHLDEALAIARQVGDKLLETAAVRAMANHQIVLGEFEKAVPLLRDSLKAEREVGNKIGEAAVLRSLGAAVCQLGDDIESEALLREAISKAKEIGDTDAPPANFGNLGYLLYTMGRFEESAEVQLEALRLAEENHHPRMAARSAQNLSATLLELGDVDGARRYLSAALRFASENSVLRLMADALEVLATLLVRTQGSLVDAAKAYGKADSLREQTRAELPQKLMARRSATEGAVRSAIGDAAFEEAYRLGQGMSLEDAAGL
ncbi:MAG: tetratricopeptide repeat protein [Armatimonadetes bacterium]|nr:tetratricopeptide repeat protein [Armatimonadota bacterium]